VIDPERARRALDEVIREEHPDKEKFVDLARALARAGDRSRAERALEISRDELDRKFAQGRVEPTELDTWLRLANMVGIDQLYAGKFDDAIVTFRRMLWARPDDNIGAYNVACGLALSGRNDEALRWLRRSVKMSNPNFQNWRHISADRDLVSIYGDPRFKRLMHELRREQERRPFPSFDSDGE
jgi:predicted Zn-dependent protease